MKTVALSALLTEDVVFLDLNATSPEEVIRHLGDKLDSHAAVKDAHRLVEDALKREQELPTGLEHGIAMPHARTDAVKSIVCAFARLGEPLNFQAPDDTLSDLVFFSAVPADGLDSYLHITAALVRRLSKAEVREALRSASEPADVIALLAGNH